MRSSQEDERLKKKKNACIQATKKEEKVDTVVKEKLGCGGKAYAHTSWSHFPDDSWSSSHMWPMLLQSPKCRKVTSCLFKPQKRAPHMMHDTSCTGDYFLPLKVEGHLPLPPLSASTSYPKVVRGRKQRERLFEEKVRYDYFPRRQ